MTLSIDETNQISQKLFELYGFLAIHYKPTFVQRALEKFANDHGMKCFETLMNTLISDESFAKDFKARLSVNFSEMFRDPEVFEALRKLLKEKFKDKSRVKIWCAGCSTGQEPYSVAILLHELEILDKSLIYATDIDIKSLKFAEEGRYHNSLVIKYVENYYLSGGKEKISKYFDISSSESKIKDFLKKHIKFAKHDILIDKFFGEFDLILARNIFMYLKDSSQNPVLEKFSNALCAGGVFAIGQNECLHHNNDVTKLIEFDQNNNFFISK